MKIIIAGSLQASEEILNTRDKLISMDHEVEIPRGVKEYEKRGRKEITQQEIASDKIEHDLIRAYFKKIQNYDVLLVVNPEKRGVPGYIGGNTLIEMSFGYVLNKTIYLMYPIPDMPYTDEIQALQPIILNSDLTKIF